ncbi:MAG: diaminopimelate decarboxylase [Trueperaceae bacterium]
MSEIAERFGTPTYVYDLAAIRRQVRRLQGEFADAALLYAVKANPNGEVLRELARLGVGAESITLGELERVLLAGIPALRALVGGPGQDARLIDRAAELGVAQVSLDSRSQWELWRDRRHETNRFLVRINPQLDPGTHRHLATGAAASKFGMPESEALDLAAELARDGVLAGFHFHVGSQISSLSVYERLAEIVGRVFTARPEADTLDLGGGFAVPDFPLAEFAVIARDLAARSGARLLLEPGRFLVAEAEVLLTKVSHLKPGLVRHVIADAGMADLLRPALYGAQHPVRRLGDPHGGESADLDGPLCENADRLAQGVPLPGDLKRGDVLVVEQAGAYGMAMASNYASSLRPAEVAVDGDEVRLTRRRETTEDLLRLEFP